MSKRLSQDFIKNAAFDVPKNIGALIDKKIGNTLIKSNIIVPNVEIEITDEFKKKISTILNNNKLTTVEKFNIIQDIIKNTHVFKNKSDDYIINLLMQNKDFNSFVINTFGIKGKDIINDYINENEKSWSSFFKKVSGKSFILPIMLLFNIFIVSAITIFFIKNTDSKFFFEFAIEGSTKDIFNPNLTIKNNKELLTRNQLKINNKELLIQNDELKKNINQVLNDNAELKKIKDLEEKNNDKQQMSTGFKQGLYYVEEICKVIINIYNFGKNNF